MAARAVPARARRRRRGRRSVGAELVMLAATVYFLLPLFWLLVASTKSISDLFSSFGLWFAHDFNLGQNIQDLLATRTLDGGTYLVWVRNSLLYSVSSAFLAALLAALWLAGLWVYTVVLTAALPGLSAFRAFQLNALGSAVSNLVPFGGAIGVGLTVALTRRRWRFAGPDVAAFVVLTGIVNVLARLALGTEWYVRRAPRTVGSGP